MIVLDLVAILVFSLLVVDYERSGDKFFVWFFERGGFVGYFLRCFIIMFLIIIASERIDWNFLNYKLF